MFIRSNDCFLIRCACIDIAVYHRCIVDICNYSVLSGFYLILLPQLGIVDGCRPNDPVGCDLEVLRQIR